MTDIEDTWPTYETGPAKHLHALGVVSLNYNLYEWVIGLFVARYFDADIADAVLERMSNHDRIQLLTHLARQRHTRAPQLVEDVDFIVSHFRACADNRNILFHSHQTHESDGALLRLRKLGRGKALVLQLELEDIRRVADEMSEGLEFASEVYMNIADMIGDEEVRVRAWPKRPRSPRSLSEDARRGLE